MFSKFSATQLCAPPGLDLTFASSLATLINSGELHADTLLEIANRICDRRLEGQVNDSVSPAIYPHCQY